MRFLGKVAAKHAENREEVIVMMHRICVVVLLLGYLALPASVADATSLLAQHSGNGAFVSAGISRAGFFGATTDDTLSVGPFFAGPPDHWPAVAEGERQFANSDLSIISPDVGDGSVSGSMSTILTFGGPSSNDSLHFFTTASASALTAADSTLEEQNAIIELFGRLEFFIDPGLGGAAAGDYVGDLHLDAGTLLTGGIDPLDPRVSSYIGVEVSHIIADPPPFEPLSVIASTDGRTALDIELFAGRGYVIDFRFGLLVPHGIDPDVEYNLFGSFNPVQPVPEPSSAGLLGLGITALVARRLRRKGTHGSDLPR